MIIRLRVSRASVDKTNVEVFVARQPIFDRKRQLYGYELLYRSNQARNQFDGTEAPAATKQVISNTLLSIGLENILCGKKAFLNFDQDLLSEGVYLSLPRQSTVIEILESVEPNSGLIALCRAIHDQGYTIALDDFVSSPQFEPLTSLAQLIKVDIRVTIQTEQERLLRTYRPRGIALLAEKVETYEEFEWARGCRLRLLPRLFLRAAQRDSEPASAGLEAQLPPSAKRIARGGPGFQAYRISHLRRRGADLQIVALHELRAVRPRVVKFSRSNAR